MTRPLPVFVYSTRAGWWARIENPERPAHEGQRMDRGPYFFKWMAKLAFPIQRWTW